MNTFFNIVYRDDCRLPWLLMHRTSEDGIWNCVGHFRQREAAINKRAKLLAMLEEYDTWIDRK